MATDITQIPAAATPTKPIGHRVTISLFGTEQGGKALEIAKSQIPNIINIKTKLAAAAVKNLQSMSPEIVISILLIPDWSIVKNDFNNPNYTKSLDAFISGFSAELKAQKQADIKVEDFYRLKCLSDAERGYLQKLSAKGSAADMIKTHAIVCNHNRDLHHLQMDSNIKIINYDELYKSTFGSSDQQDALNASYYDFKNFYVSAHNKIVYTPATTGLISQSLKSTHERYCQEHKDDHLNPNTQAEKVSQNSIYSKDFVVALASLSLTSKKTITVSAEDTADPTKTRLKDLYLASLDKPAYRITRHVLTTVSMSWSEGENSYLKDIKDLPKITHPETGIECDPACFVSIVKKHTDELKNHSQNPIDDNQVHDQLMAISHTAFEKNLVRLFMDNVAKVEHHNLIKAVKIIPSTPRGNMFFEGIFGCSRDVYKAKKSVEHDKETALNNSRRVKP